MNGLQRLWRWILALNEASIRRGREYNRSVRAAIAAELDAASLDPDWDRRREISELRKELAVLRTRYDDHARIFHSRPRLAPRRRSFDLSVVAAAVRADHHDQKSAEV